MNKLLKDKKVIFLFIFPAILLYTLLLIIPIIGSSWNSLFRWNVISSRRFIMFDNYVRMFTKDDVFVTSIKNMFFLVGTSLFFQLLSGFLLAVILCSGIKGENLFKNVFFLPAVISTVAVGMLWTFIYDPKIGLINDFLRIIGLGNLVKPWLTSKDTAMWSLTIVVAWQYMGYTLILFIAAIHNISADIFDAAKIDGAISYKRIRYIILPLVKPITKVCVILISVNSMKFFDLVYVMTGGGPAHATEVLASHIYNRSFFQFEYGYGNALSIVLLAMCLLITLIINQIFKNRHYEN